MRTPLLRGVNDQDRVDRLVGLVVSIADTNKVFTKEIDIATSRGDATFEPKFQRQFPLTFIF